MQGHLKLNKKILIVSSWAPPSLGGTQNLYNHLIQFEPDNYLVLTSRINFELHKKYKGEKLPVKYYFYDNYGTLKNYSDRYLLKITKRVKKSFDAAKIGCKTISQNDIKLLVGVSDTGFALFLTFILSFIKKVPYVLFMFDLYRGNNFSSLKKITSFVLEPIIFWKAKTIIVTNEGTRDYLKKRYGTKKKIEVVYNTTFPGQYEKLRKVARSDACRKIVFTGKIYWPQKQAIQNVLRNFSTIDDSNIIFVIYSPDVDEKVKSEFSSDKRIQFKVAKQKQMPKIQSDADLLLLPFSFKTRGPDIIKTASPSKLTDYLISGSPILIYAPEYSFICKYAKKYQFAHVVSSEDANCLKIGIRKILTNNNYSHSLTKKAKRLFYKNHDPFKNSIILQRIINEI